MAFFNVVFLAFPSWEEGANDVLCAKFIYFYEPKCFRNHTNIIMQEILNLQGVKRLQGTFITIFYIGQWPYIIFKIRIYTQKLVTIWHLH